MSSKIASDGTNCTSIKLYVFLIEFIRLGYYYNYLSHVPTADPINSIKPDQAIGTGLGWLVCVIGSGREW